MNTDGIMIKINGEELKIKKTFGGLMLFEKMTGKEVFKMNDSISDIIMLFYCLIKSNNKNFNMNFEDFVTHLDNSDDLDFFVDYLKEEQEKEEKKETEKKNLK